MTKTRLLPFLLLAACSASPLDGLTTVAEDPSDLPFAGLTPDLEDRFVEGDALFEAMHREADGLGPLYIRASCASCHADDAKGPGGVTKMVLVDDDGAPLADQSGLSFGHTVRAQRTAGATTPVEPPTEALVRTSLRIGPAVFGRGYLEAIADTEIERVEAEQAQRTDGVSGRIHRVCRTSKTNPDQSIHTYEEGRCGLIGRFGVKARIATLDDFTADAYQGDMGITSPLRPNELPNPDGLEDDGKPGLDVTIETVNFVADYVRLLRIPKRAEPGTEGPALFARAQCAVCHVPSMTTRADHPVAQLAGVAAPIYSDLLLHDLGEALADGVSDGNASGREWKTAPLLGMRHLRAYLHDGRSTTIDDAILAHEGPGSEANASIAAYRALSSTDRDTLVRFVRSL